MKVDLLIDSDFLIMVRKDIRGSVCHAIHQYMKLIINTWKIMIKIENPCISSTGM